jgi:hypothetical protein
VGGKRSVALSPQDWMSRAYDVDLGNAISHARVNRYQHANDAGQLPICDTGWGFFNLNLLAATLQV